MSHQDVDKAVQDAMDDNLGRDAADFAQNKVEGKVKSKAKGAAKDGAKKAGGAAHRFMSKHSKIYSGVSKKVSGGKGALKQGAKLAKAGAKTIGKFLITPPIGWVVSVIIIAIIITASNSGALDNMGSGSDMTQEEQYLALQQTCVIEDYRGPVGDDVGDSDWTTVGTVAYNNAKRVYDFWTGRGLSGASAAGLVGWVNSEGGFEMVGRAEGVYETDPRKGSLRYKIEPIPYGNYEKGGGGIYQFTPYDKYAKLGSRDWENLTKMNKFVANQIIGGDWKPTHDMTGGQNTFNDFAKETDPEMATLMWNAYERANQDTVKVAQKKSDAQKAYTMFDADKVSYDDKRFQKYFGSPEDIEFDNGVYEDPCKPDGSAWMGEGGQPSINSGAWRLTNVPEEMREFALDPRTIGMMPNMRETWPELVSPGGTGGQCTDLSASLMEMLWEDASGPLVTRNGNGIDVAHNLAAHHGVPVTKEPTPGAIFSSNASSKYGHTGLVSYVFDNGDFLIIEQNVKGLSGDSDNSPLTWNYRYIQKSQIRINKYFFFDPTEAGYSIVNNVGSL